MLFFIDLADIGLFLLYVFLPILIIYLGYLIYTNAFKYMGFSTLEAIIILFISIIFWRDIYIYDYNISNIYLFTYNNWNLAINVGGAIIPIFLSIYLTIKKKIALKNILIGIIIVSIVTFFVTEPIASKGIISTFPYWLLPSIIASLISIVLLWKDFKKAAPLAYISGTLGVLIGADFLHLWELLNMQVTSQTSASIGGAVVFDMIYITGVLAVIIDGFLMFRKRQKADKS